MKMRFPVGARGGKYAANQSWGECRQWRELHFRSPCLRGDVAVVNILGGDSFRPGLRTRSSKVCSLIDPWSRGPSLGRTATALKSQPKEILLLVGRGVNLDTTSNGVSS